MKKEKKRRGPFFSLFPPSEAFSSRRNLDSTYVHTCILAHYIRARQYYQIFVRLLRISLKLQGSSFVRPTFNAESSNLLLTNAGPSHVANEKSLITEQRIFWRLKLVTISSYSLAPSWKPQSHARLKALSLFVVIVFTRNFHVSLIPRDTLSFIARRRLSIYGCYLSFDVRTNQ